MVDHSSPNADARDVTLRESFRRVATSTAGPVLLLWLLASVAEYLLLDFIGIGEALLGWTMDLEGPPFAVFLAAAALPFLAAFRDALYRPARKNFHGGSTDLAETALSAISVMFPVMGAQFMVALAQIGVLGLCQWMAVPFPAYVILPITFALSPAVYFAATRRTGGFGAIRLALELWRRRWVTIFAAHSLAILVVVMLSDTPMAAGTLTSLRELGAELTRSYLAWLIVSSAYLHVDSQTDKNVDC